METMADLTLYLHCRLTSPADLECTGSLNLVSYSTFAFVFMWFKFAKRQWNENGTRITLFALLKSEFTGGFGYTVSLCLVN